MYVNRYVIAGIAGGVGIVVGLGAGYFAAKKQLEPKYVEIAQQEIADAKDYYSRLYKKDAFANPVDLVSMETAEVIIDQLGYEAEKTSINPEGLDNERLMTEIEQEIEQGRPHAISHMDWVTSELDYEQVTLTYFEEDDVLVDVDDSVIQEMDELIGIKHLTMFGFLSDDNNIIYIRNVPKEVEYEVIRHKGSFAKDILGFIEHGESKVRRFRRDDE